MHRLASAPRRLLKRYWVTNTLFVWGVGAAVGGTALIKAVTL
jgi:hypothetical protein